MKFRFLTLAIAATIVSVSCARIPHTGKVTLKNETDSVSNALGMMIAKQMVASFQGPFDTINVKAVAEVYAKSKIKKEMFDRYKTSFDSVSQEQFYAGMFNHLVGSNDAFTSEKADAYLRGVYQKNVQKKQEARAKAGIENLSKGKAFLEQNAKKAGVSQTASGLQYEVIKAGSGPKPKATDKVKVNYEGSLLDGTVFDSSIKRGTPATFPVNQVIPGWTEALQLMNVGSKYKLYIPSELAYGEQGGGEKIGANETLIFEVELLEITQ